MPFVGADVAALRSLAQLLRFQRDVAAGSVRRLDALVESLPWTGPDRSRFVEEWAVRHRPALEAVVGELDRAARIVDHGAARQEQASWTAVTTRSGSW